MKRKMKKKVKKKQKFSFHNEVEEAWKYLKNSDNYVAIVAGAFALFFMIGFVFPYIAPPEILGPILEEVRKLIENIIRETEGKNFIQMWEFIFVNNASIALFATLFGFFLGVVPIFFLMSNGLMIGLISSLVTREAGFSSLWMLVPHGIFEIPAIIISFAMGIKFGAFIFCDDKLKEFKFRLNNSLRVFFFIILPLLVLAAIIEAGLIVFFSG